MQAHAKSINSDQNDVKLALNKEKQTQRHNDIKVGLADVDRARVIGHSEILDWVKRLRKE
ncbi:hypothetical protein [Leclercia sp.]|uniref:hypothetical protein n=1 Tax=Leclercia sp. TaxID=1898428 RepID=UPI002FDE4AE1